MFEMFRALVDSHRDKDNGFAIRDTNGDIMS